MKKSDTQVIKDKLLSPYPIFQMVIGFWISKSLMTAFELDLFTKLSNSKAVTLEQLRTDILGMERRPADVFVTALISLGLLDTTVTNNEYEEKESNKRLLYSNSEISRIS